MKKIFFLFLYIFFNSTLLAKEEPEIIQHDKYKKIYQINDLENLINLNENLSKSSATKSQDVMTDLKFQITPIDDKLLEKIEISKFKVLEKNQKYLISNQISKKNVENINLPNDISCEYIERNKYCFCDSFEEINIKSTNKIFHNFKKNNNLKYNSDDEDLSCVKYRKNSYYCFYIKDLKGNFIMDAKKNYIEACTPEVSLTIKTLIDKKNKCTNAKKIIDEGKIFFDCNN